MFPFDRFRFRLTWLFALTAVIGLVVSWYVYRQDALELERSKLKGTWKVAWADSGEISKLAWANSGGISSLPFDFSDPGFELLRPGVIGAAGFLVSATTESRSILTRNRRSEKL